MRLDGTVLFVTLEPCAPGSRAHPKLGCAERIVLARIKDVWIGIEDPDPLVDRKGIKYLQDHGVVVHMCDRELQDTIREEYAAFIAQAAERALASRDEAERAVTLSPLEGAFQAVDLDDLSPEALEDYRLRTGVPDSLESAAFRRRLCLQGLMTEAHGCWKPSGFGVLLFGKEPRTAIRQAGLLATMYLADGREETVDFDGPQVLVPKQALRWLRDKLPNPIARKHGDGK